MFEHYDVDSLTDYIDIEFEANEEVYYLELLTLNNLHVKLIEKDGNCFFSCVSHFLRDGNVSFHSFYRQQIMDYIEINKIIFEKFIYYNENIYPNFEEYIKYMRLNQTWGDNIEISAFSSLYSLNVHVHVLNSSDVIFNNNSNEDNWFHLYYNGRNHYNVLLLKSDISVLPTKVVSLSISLADEQLLLFDMGENSNNTSQFNSSPVDNDIIRSTITFLPTINEEMKNEPYVADKIRNKCGFLLTEKETKTKSK